MSLSYILPSFIDFSQSTMRGRPNGYMRSRRQVRHYRMRHTNASTRTKRLSGNSRNATRRHGTRSTRRRRPQRGNLYHTFLAPLQRGLYRLTRRNTRRTRHGRGATSPHPTLRSNGSYLLMQTMMKHILPHINNTIRTTIRMTKPNNGIILNTSKPRHLVKHAIPRTRRVPGTIPNLNRHQESMDHQSQLTHHRTPTNTTKRYTHITNNISLVNRNLPMSVNNLDINMSTLGLHNTTSNPVRTTHTMIIRV